MPLRLPLRWFGAWVRALGRSRQRSDISRQPPTVILPAWSAWHPRDGGSPAIGSATIVTGMELLANHGRHGGELLRVHFLTTAMANSECAGLEASCGCMEVRCRHCNSKLPIFCCDALVCIWHITSFRRCAATGVALGARRTSTSMRIKKALWRTTGPQVSGRK